MANLRFVISDILNELTYSFVKRNRILLKINGKMYNTAVFLKRFQLVFVENLFVDNLLADHVPAVPPTSLCLTARFETPKRRPGRVMKFLRTLLDSTRSRIVTLLLCVLSRYKQRELAKARRVFFVDAQELKRAQIDGRGYFYHKYLEGLVDFDSLGNLDNDLIVLYGMVSHLRIRYLLSHRVVALESFRKQYDPDLESVLEGVVRDVFENSQLDSMGLKSTQASSYGLSSQMLGAVRGKYVQENSRFFRDILVSDLNLIAAAESLLRNLQQDAEIYLDNYDSTLFTLSQFILENYNHKVIGIQKVLGPYVFPFNISHNQRLFREPAKILTWSHFHNEQLKALGYTCTLEDSCAYKLRKYRELKTLDRANIKRRLGISTDKTVILFSAVRKIHNFDLIDTPRYLALLGNLATLCDQDPSIFVLFKPWPGENVAEIARHASALFSHNSHLVIDESLARRFHNPEIMTIADIMVSTLSSFIGEGLFFKVIPVLINYKPSQRYFSREYTHEFKGITYELNEDTDATALFARLVALSERERIEFFDRVEEKFKYLFGDVPGK